jgi:hypothetical protein
MNAIQILAAQPWVERLGLTLLHFLWQGLIIVAIYGCARKWGATRHGAKRSLSSRLFGTHGHGYRATGDLDAAARAGGGICRRHLHSTHVRRSNRARSIHLCIASEWTGPCRVRIFSVLGGRDLVYRRDRFLAAPAGWLDTRPTSSVRNGAPRVRRMAAYSG